MRRIRYSAIRLHLDFARICSSTLGSCTGRKVVVVDGGVRAVLVVVVMAEIVGGTVLFGTTAGTILWLPADEVRHEL